MSKINVSAKFRVKISTSSLPTFNDKFWLIRVRRHHVVLHNSAYEVLITEYDFNKRWGMEAHCRGADRCCNA